MEFRCFFCGSELIWGSSCNLKDVCADAEDNDGGTVSFYTCPKCGRSYEIYDPIEEERETSYKEYWINNKSDNENERNKK